MLGFASLYPTYKNHRFPPRPIKKPTLGRYEILGQIGKGAMGIVYKGRDPKLNRLTAIKTIRFIDEFDSGQVLTKLHHKLGQPVALFEVDLTALGERDDSEPTILVSGRA